ncbi:MAG: molybdenum cofactor biosynthesis protein MoaE [Nocardioidaceae bacterium]
MADHVPGQDPGVRLAAVVEGPIDVPAVIAAVGDPAAGAVAVFIGTVRDHDEGRSVTALEYHAHPHAERELRAVLEEVVARYDGIAVAAVHRVGGLAIGDAAVCVAASAAHRAASFDTCRDLIDELKERVPIWKHQSYPNGDRSWVGA